MDDLYWELNIAQLDDWLSIRDKPLERDVVGNSRIPDIPIDDIKFINKIIDAFRSKREGTDEGGPVIYNSIKPSTAGRCRSGYCWFLEKPIASYKGCTNYIDIELSIHKFSDDWHLVRWEDNPVSWNTQTRWFVCDEMAGVEKLLKQLLY